MEPDKCDGCGVSPHYNGEGLVDGVGLCLACKGPLPRGTQFYCKPACITRKKITLVCSGERPK